MIVFNNRENTFIPFYNQLYNSYKDKEKCLRDARSGPQPFGRDMVGYWLAEGRSTSARP